MRSAPLPAVVLVVAAASVAAVLLCGTAAAAQDVHGHNREVDSVLRANHDNSTPDRLVVIGDIHGDYDQAVALLKLAGVAAVDKSEDGQARVRWLGGSSTRLVQMGDLVDRGPQDKEVIDLFMDLTRQAEAAGSSVVVLLGNHELMNLMGDLRYVNPDSNAAFGGLEKRKELMAKGGVYGDYLRSLPVAHAFNGTVFVHAGLSKAYAQYGVATINKVAFDALASNDFDNALFSGDGPVWTRLLINRAEYGRCTMVEDSLHLLGADTMVVGHTPQRSLEVTNYCGSSLIAVDVGISKHMYGGLSALEITTDFEKDPAGRKVLQEITTDNAVQRAAEEQERLEKGGGLDANVLGEIMDTLGEELRASELERKAKADSQHDEL